MRLVNLRCLMDEVAVPATGFATTNTRVCLDSRGLQSNGRSDARRFASRNASYICCAIVHDVLAARAWLRSADVGEESVVSFGVLANSGTRAAPRLRPSSHSKSDSTPSLRVSSGLRVSLALLDSPGSTKERDPLSWSFERV